MKPPHVKASARPCRPAAITPCRNLQNRANAAPSQTTGCMWRVSVREPNSPDLGCPRRVTTLLHFVLGWTNWTRGQGPGEMSSLIVARRQFLQGVASVAVCAPGIVRASSLMRISARHCVFSPPATSWATAPDALAVLQHEMERRFVETLFGEDGRLAEAENDVPTRNSIVAGAKITALWELRTWFGPRGSPPKPFEELPADVRAGLFSMLGSSPT